MSGWINSRIESTSARKTNDIGTGHASLGNYYNWSAAIASNNSDSLASENNNANNSICPKNWRLPNIVNNEFTTLNNLYNNGSTISSANLTIAPLYYVKNGYINNRGSYIQEAQGTYSSSTIWSYYDNRYLYFDDNKISTGECYYCTTKARGFAVRCLSR